MLARIDDEIAAAQEHADLARVRAILASSDIVKRDYLHLEQHWLRLADGLDFARRVSGFLQWNSQRVQPPPM